MSATRTVYSVKLREALEDVRPAFRELGQGLDQLTKKRTEMAPVFMKAYQIWRRETKRPFIAFVHELDPTMPVSDRKAYRTHRSYYAAQYLRQLAEKPEKGAGPRGLTPIAMLAVTIKSFLPLCGSQKEQKQVLEILTRTTRWRDRDVKKLVAKIRRAKAVGLPNIPRLIEATKTTKAVVVAFERERLSA